MGRSNVIIVGSVVLAPLLLGTESYLLFKARHGRMRAAQTTESFEVTVPSTPLTQSSSTPAPADLPSPALPIPLPAPPAPGDAAPSTETVIDVEADPTVDRRRQLILRRRGEVLQAADEQGFELLHLSNEQRAAIRAIDSAYRRTVQALEQLPPDADLRNAGLDPNAEQARHAAIGEVLGPKVAQAFNFAERKAERRVRNQYRPEQVRGR
jgi:hypothetical protein